MEQLTSAEREQIMNNLRRLTKLMDSSIKVPGTGGFSVGLDPILGLIPVVGDAISLAVSSYIILQARRLGVSKFVLTRMLLNVGVDTAVGALPLVGDVFDFAFKANKKNLKLLGLTDNVIDTTARPLR